MSYDISFKVKAEGVDAYINVGECEANITWNVRDIITQSTGLAWENEANNGLCAEIVPQIAKGLFELQMHPEKYKPLEDKDGFGTVDGVQNFFWQIIKDWDKFKREYEQLAPVATFWIE